MTWPEAREKALAGQHVRREVWPASCWLIYHRGIAWYWDGMLWRVVEAWCFGVAEWEATDWTHIPRELDNCCLPITFDPCDGRWSHFTGFSNPNLTATNVRLISLAPAIIELRMDTPGMGLNDGVWVPLNEVAGTEAVTTMVRVHPRNAYALPWEIEWVPETEWIPPWGSAESWFVGWRLVEISPASPFTWKTLDHTFLLPAGGHFSIRTVTGKHAANVPIEVIVCFGAQIPPYDPAKPEVEYEQDTAAPPRPPIIIPPRPLPPKPICTDYSYPLRGADYKEIFGEFMVSNPFSAVARVTITGSVDDELVVNGARVEGGSAGAHSDVNYSLILSEGESCTIGGADNYSGNVWYDYRVCMTPLGEE